jgi:hypothetical protein
VVVARSGTFHVVAAGRANHSGTVDLLDYSNPYSLGLCAEHSGTTSMPGGQYLALVTGAAVLGKHYGIRWRGHKEAAVPVGRKQDPVFVMDKFRAVLTQPVKGDVFMSAEAEKLLMELDAHIRKNLTPAITRSDAADQATIRLVRQIAKNVEGIDVDEDAIVAGILAGLPVERLAQAIVEGLPSGSLPSLMDNLELVIREREGRGAA